MSPVTRRIVMFGATVLVAGAAMASDVRQAPAPATSPATTADNAAPRSDRLDQRVVDRETQRRTTPKAPVMPAERA